jgi:hypothetical protein
MNKRKRQKIMKLAALMIETGENEFSCSAIKKAEYMVTGYHTLTTATEYAEFYEKFFNEVRVFSDGSKLNNTPDENTNIRLMLMAWFSELGLEALDE